VLLVLARRRTPRPTHVWEYVRGRYSTAISLPHRKEEERPEYPSTSTLPPPLPRTVDPSRRRVGRQIHTNGGRRLSNILFTNRIVNDTIGMVVHTAGRSSGWDSVADGRHCRQSDGSKRPRREIRSTAPAANIRVPGAKGEGVTKVPLVRPARTSTTTVHKQKFTINGPYVWTGVETSM